MSLLIGFFLGFFLIIKLFRCFPRYVRSSLALMVPFIVLFRSLLSRVLDPEGDIEIIAEASNVRELKGAIRQVKADLLLLDMDMDGLNAPEVLSLVRKKNPDLGVLLIIMRYSDEKRIVEALCAGAMGYILKSANTGELIKSIRALVQREVWIQRKMMAKVISRFSSLINTFHYTPKVMIYS